MRFPTEGTTLHETEHRVNSINLDFNGHVNNRTYLSIAMQSADEAFLDTHAIQCLTIHWLRETFLGDTLRCRLMETDTSDTTQQPSGICFLHTLTRNDGLTAAQVFSQWTNRTIRTDIADEAPRN
jgi:acyl-ACP thioesterase